MVSSLKNMYEEHLKKEFIIDSHYCTTSKNQDAKCQILGVTSKPFQNPNNKLLAIQYEFGFPLNIPCQCK